MTLEGLRAPSCCALQPPQHLAVGSQSHGPVGVGRDFQRSPGLTPLLKAGSLQQVEQGRVLVGLEYLQRRRLGQMGRNAPRAVLWAGRAQGSCLACCSQESSWGRDQASCPCWNTAELGPQGIYIPGLLWR